MFVVPNRRRGCRKGKDASTGTTVLVKIATAARTGRRRVNERFMVVADTIVVLEVVVVVVLCCALLFCVASSWCDENRRKSTKIGDALMKTTRDSISGMDRADRAWKVDKMKWMCEFDEMDELRGIRFSPGTSLRNDPRLCHKTWLSTMVLRAASSTVLSTAGRAQQQQQHGAHNHHHHSDNKSNLSQFTI